MQRRLNLVAGVLHEPRVLLLDEPTVGIDPDARLRVHALLENLREQGMTILLTTHDLDEAAALSNRIGFLVDGRLRAEGTLDELLEATLHGRAASRGVARASTRGRRTHGPRWTRPACEPGSRALAGDAQ